MAFAILVLDAGVTLTHIARHRWSTLWRYHAVHHSVQRTYGLNGLMKHPLHQLIVDVGGILPLVLLEFPPAVASAVVFAVAVQLVLEHANVDYRAGPLNRLLLAAEIHRFHHRKGAGLGDVDFGLFTTIWDRLLLAGSGRRRPGHRNSRATGLPLRVPRTAHGTVPSPAAVSSTARERLAVTARFDLRDSSRAPPFSLRSTLILTEHQDRRG